MGATKRSQNTCSDCNYTWYPKGKNLSRECPNCKSKNVKMVGPGVGSILGGLIAIGIAIAIFGGNKKSEDNVSPVIVPTETAAVQAPAETRIQAPPAAVIPDRPAQVAIVPDRPEQPSAALPMAENERVVSEEELRQMKAQAAEQEQRLTADASAPDASK